MKNILIPILFFFILSACGTETEVDNDPPVPEPQPDPVADTRAQYSVTLTISDDTEQIELRFGQHVNPATQDEQMPPPPPEGTLHAFFTKDNKGYWRDFRSETSEAEDWNFTFQTGDNGPVTLKWNVQSTRLPGTLTLFDPEDNSELEMESTGEIELPKSTNGNLIFEYRLD